MSVILMSGKKSAQKFKEGSNSKDKEKRPNEKNYTVSTANSYMPSETVDVWNCVLNGSPVSIALCKDTLEIWCNDVLINPTEIFNDAETKMDFSMMSHKMSIVFSLGKDGKEPKSILTVNGEIIPHVAQTVFSKSPHSFDENDLKVNNTNVNFH